MRSIRQIFFKTLLAGCVIWSAGCFQGRPSERPPIHINPNMDSQPRYDPQEKSAFFADGSAMRMPVPGTVARGTLQEDDGYYRGVDANGDTLRTMPMSVTMAMLTRGRERYEIYCTPCHGGLGDGAGIIVSRGYVPPTNFHQDLVRNYPDGHLFSVIGNGIRNMPGYKSQISVEDRWAIVAYVRALQRSQNARPEDVPQGIRSQND